MKEKQKKEEEIENLKTQVTLELEMTFNDKLKTKVSEMEAFY
jgi:hypothetical protein